MGGNLWKRILWMVLGNVLLGVGSGCFRIAELGLDAYSCLILGLSDLTGVQFGTTMLIINSMLLVVMLFLDIRQIGAGTIVNLIVVGYVSDGTVWLVREGIGYRPEGFTQSLFLVLGLVLIALGIALYTTPELGTSPYDDLANIIVGRSKGRIKYHYARLIGDATSLVGGITVALIAGQSVFHVAGIGTVCSAVLTGFLVSYAKKYVAIPLILGRKKNGKKRAD